MSARTVVVLNDYCHINGGASHVAIDEAVGLAESGMKVFFFGANGPVGRELQNAPLTTICLDQPELINVGKSPAVITQGLWNFKAHREMTKLLATLDPANTVVHLHGYTKALTSSPVRAAVSRGFKVVCTLHDFFAACPNGAFFDYVKSVPCPKVGMSLDCIGTHCDKRNYGHKLYRVARSAVQKYAGLLPGGVNDYITLSNRSAALLKPYLPARAQYHALENLIEAEKTAPVDVAANDAVVTVGRLDIEKGIEVLLEAARRADVKLVLVGDGPLRAKAEHYKNCRVTGWVSPQVVAQELAKARCLVFPSIWYEAYGLTVAEAAARGVPAIVSDISAAAERVTNGVHGWVTKAGNVEDLSTKLLYTKDNTLLRAAGQAAYTRFWNAPPTRQNHIAQLFAIYEKILAATPERQAS